ncbi:MAG: hypothetical protein ACPIOQ_38625, partial [Promethearchaeia archaeon]
MFPADVPGGGGGGGGGPHWEREPDIPGWQRWRSSARPVWPAFSNRRPAACPLNYSCLQHVTALLPRVRRYIDARLCSQQRNHTRRRLRHIVPHDV